MKKIFSLLFFLIILFSFSQTNNVQAISSSHCWTEKDCIKYRKDNFLLATDGTENGFVTTTESINICNTDAEGKNEFFEGEKYGFCVASSEVKTKISIAGRNSFTGIQDFISYIYRYSFIVASIVAVIIVIISGIQWIVSAGNSSTISEAKKRIGGAIIGLILLAFSYTILYTINPYLVMFKPFNIYIINEEGIHTYCSQITKTSTKLYDEIESNTPVSPTSTECGTTYYIEGNESNTCIGDTCLTNGQMCAKADINTSTYSCIDANITGKVISNSFEYLVKDSLGSLNFSEGWKWKWVKNPKIYMVCNDGDYKILTTKKTSVEEIKEIKKQLYKVQLNNQNIDTSFCTEEKKYLKGFVLELAFNENLDLSGHEEHFIGITECNKANICFGIDIGDITRIKTSLYKTNKKYLITKEQLKKGITVNINVSNIMDIDFFDDDLKEKMKIYDLLNN